MAAFDSTPPVVVALLLAVCCICGAVGEDHHALGSDSLLCSTTLGRSLDATLFGSCLAEEPPQRQELKVIMAGMGRCGSSSLKAALERLGFRAMHGSDVVSHPSVVDAVRFHRPERLVEETEKLGYNATMETHSAWWEPMLRMRPNAKIILPVREPESWYKSVEKVNAVIGPVQRFPLKYVSLFHNFDLVSAHVFSELGLESDGCLHGTSCKVGSPKQRERFMTALKRIEADADRVVPDGQLLKFELGKHGYPELCKFLDVAPGTCPPASEPFPWINSGAEMDSLSTAFRIMEVLVWLGVIAPFALVFWLGRWSARRTQSQQLKSKAKKQ